MSRFFLPDSFLVLQFIEHPRVVIWGTDGAPLDTVQRRICAVLRSRCPTMRELTIGEIFEQGRSFRSVIQGDWPDIVVASFVLNSDEGIEQEVYQREDDGWYCDLTLLLAIETGPAE